MPQPLTVNISIRVPRLDDPPVVRSEHLNLYVDETTIPLPSGKEVFGVGVLSTWMPVGRELVDRAMEKLRADPDRENSSPGFCALSEKLDRTTIARGHFHASFDSKNSHSFLAEEIRGGIDGSFVFSFAELGSQAERIEFRRHAVRAILTTLKTRTPVTCVFERRSGLSADQAERLIEEMNAGLDWCAYEQPMIRAYYPRISATVADKGESGLQVTDMLLWSLGQSLFHGQTKKAPWADRCGLFVWSDAKVPDASFHWVQCTLNRQNPLFSQEQDFFVPYPMTSSLEEGVAEKELAQAYLLAERTLRLVSARTLPPRAEHLRPGVERALRSLENYELVGPDEIRRVASAFLRLFDTVPVYNDMEDDHPGWLALLRAKKFLGLTLRQDVLNGVRTTDFFVAMRRENARSIPAAFGIAPTGAG